MQGKKDYQEKLFSQFQLSERIPRNNFYKRLKGVLDLDFLYGLTKGYYGNSGRKSMDRVFFFKLCSVGYLENIISDRKLIEHCSLRLDILFFIGLATKRCPSIAAPRPKRSRTVQRARSARGCPLRATCLGRVNEKQFSVTYLLPGGVRAEHRAGRKSKGQVHEGQATGNGRSGVRYLDPVHGAAINTIGLKQTNKAMHLSAIAYNLKKYLKFERKRQKAGRDSLL